MPSRLVLICGLATIGLARATSPARTVDELHSHYREIFATGNRNAASHLWASFILNGASELRHDELRDLFGGFCPVSGSPVYPSDANRYSYSVGTLAGGEASGTTHHCCAPCVCDTTDMLLVDTKTVQTLDGAAQYNFLVMGDPCVKADALTTPFVDPFSGSSESLLNTAPELRCVSSRLRGATFSDRGGVIVGMLVDGESTHAQPAAGFAEYCGERAKSGYSSGMGLIFRAAASVNRLRRGSRALASPPPPSPDTSGCDALLPPSRRAHIHSLITSKPVLLVGIPHMRCTMAATERLESKGACFHWEEMSSSPEDEVWKYMQCLHPHEIVGGMQMHSYVYIGGDFLGNGFVLSAGGAPTALTDAALDAKLQAASADLACRRDCTSLASRAELQQLEEMRRAPLALLGWTSCPCTNIARQRFEGVGACYVQVVWPEPTAPLYKYLQCVHGAHHHSFVFVGGKFAGDGFAFDEGRMAQPAFESALAGAGARRTCQRKGDASLLDAPLKPCTQSNDGSTTGWTRTGSCNWDPSDSGYHEVCVTMSDEFLRASARHDGNDLSSVVQAGGHWCICAWAWASAVQRDPHAYEGITLECERTNAKLREVYQSFIDAGADLRSPSGAAYKAKEALDAVDRICPSSAATPAAAAVPALPAPSKQVAESRAGGALPSEPQPPAEQVPVTAVPPTLSGTTLSALVLAAAGVGVFAVAVFAWLSRRRQCAPWRDEEHETSESLRLQASDDCWGRGKVKPSEDDAEVGVDASVPAARDRVTATPLQKDLF